MPRPVTQYTGQWADIPLEAQCKKAASIGYDGLELACWGDHFDVQLALDEDGYCAAKWELLQDHGLLSFAISNHLSGQAVCDKIDERHEGILPAHVWGDGDPEGVRQRAADEMIATGRAARRFFDAAPDAVKTRLKQTGRTVVVGFTGSRIWDAVYAFPPLPAGAIDEGFADFGRRWTPILDDYQAHGISFALEVHPTEIAFDISSTRRTLDAIEHHDAFGLNFDPSHFGYQGVDYLGFLREFSDLLFNVHVKDVWWSDSPAQAGVFGGHTDFGDDGRFWDFRSPGRGRIDFEAILRILNHADYQGPLSVEWEDPMMDREHGATEAAAFVKRLDFPQSDIAFDAAFAD
jgi:sugar phosphate isomerase/epimerase